VSVSETEGVIVDFEETSLADEAVA